MSKTEGCWTEVFPKHSGRDPNFRQRRYHIAIGGEIGAVADLYIASFFLFFLRRELIASFKWVRYLYVQTYPCMLLLLKEFKFFLVRKSVVKYIHIVKNHTWKYTHRKKYIWKRYFKFKKNANICAVRKNVCENFSQCKKYGSKCAQRKKCTWNYTHCRKCVEGGSKKVRFVWIYNAVSVSANLQVVFFRTNPVGREMSKYSIEEPREEGFVRNSETLHDDPMKWQLIVRIFVKIGSTRSLII